MIRRIAVMIYRRLGFIQAIYRRLRRVYARKQLKQETRQALAKGKPLKVVIGADRKPRAGWILTEVYTLDVLDTADWDLYFPEASISAMLAEHVWEHLTREDGIRAAKNCYRYLKEGAHFRVAVPDGLFPSADYIEFVRPGGSGPSAWDHKVLYDYRTLAEVLIEAGFRVTLLEYWDENGVFHEEAWREEDGIVLRARRNAKRHFETASGARVGYTSIIIDGHK